MFIRSRITTPAVFNPATAERKFTIMASDYAYHVILADVLFDAYSEAPGVSFELLTTDRFAIERLERGEIDAVMTVNSYLSSLHPQKAIYADDHAVICWSESVHRGGLSENSYLEAGHVVAVFGADKNPAFTESFLGQQNIRRRVEVSVQSFTAMPPAVVGTNRLATMYRRHAELFAKSLPITIHEPPLPMPSIVESIQ